MWLGVDTLGPSMSFDIWGVLGVIFFWVFPIPLLGALLTLLLAKVHPKARDYCAVVTSLATALAATSLVPVLLGDGLHLTLPPWQLPWIPSLGVELGVLVDPLSVFMANVVAWLAFFIMVYSLGYMKGERSLTRYWVFMNLFLGSMLLVVLSDNLLQLFFGWEGVGLCSYQLIGFYYNDARDKWVGVPGEKALNVDMAYPPSHAGMKAFLVTRIADVFLLAAILLIWLTAGTFTYIELTEHPLWAATLAGAGLLLPVCLSLFIGAIGKSAQFPFHEWLPDAMAGPTSVSALIHAATMVKAGVYLVARMTPLFYTVLLIYGGKVVFFNTVALVGVFTAFLAGTQALVSKEIKKVLAYSTISQIGYMMLGLGAAGLAPDFAGGYVASLFHLLNHAVFKASLFMAAGAIIHTVESRFLDDMGGLKNVMRITYASMILGVLSLSGVPPFAGFWSKDAILLATISTGDWFLFTLGVAASCLTILYSLRMVGMVFHADKSHHVRHLEREGVHLHEASRLFWVPYGILAMAGLGLGLAGPFLEQGLHTFLAPLFHGIAGFPGGVDQPLALLITWSGSAIALALGGLVGFRFYIRPSFDIHMVVKNNRVLRAINRFLVNRWYMNPVFYRIFAFGAIRFSRTAYERIEIGLIDKINVRVAPAIIRASSALYSSVEQHGFDSLNTGFANLAVRLSKTADWIDLHVIDGVVNRVKSAGQRVSRSVQRVQTGVIHQYVLGLVVGLVIVVVLFVPTILMMPIVLLALAAAVIIVAIAAMR
jgi:NADH-quinone oxidoreductase subunit L